MDVGSSLWQVSASTMMWFLLIDVEVESDAESSDELDEEESSAPETDND
jgi:hypothetical protein